MNMYTVQTWIILTQKIKALHDLIVHHNIAALIGSQNVLIKTHDFLCISLNGKSFTFHKPVALIYYFIYFELNSYLGLNENGFHHH